MAEFDRMVRDRDVSAFEARAPSYESGWMGRLHHEIGDRAGDLAAIFAPASRRVLDVGCGTGYLLRRLAGQLPAAEALHGIDPAPTMVQVARSATTDPRLRFTVGMAERLPYRDATFDLLISTTSFDHWGDQQAGLAECARVLREGGQLVLCDQFSTWLLPTLFGDRRGKARTKGRATALLVPAGFAALQWHALYTPLIRAVTAIRAGS